jgi:hypothetical protein
MSQTTIPTDLFVAGNIAGKSMTIPAGAVNDAAVQASAGIQATKLQHQYQPAYAQASATAATSESRVIYAVQGATATVVGFAAGAVTPAVGADTCSVDLKKNGTSILSAPVSLTNAQTARQLVTGALSSNSAVAGDVFEVAVTPNHSSGTLPAGVFARLTIHEDAQ